LFGAVVGKSRAGAGKYHETRFPTAFRDILSPKSLPTHPWCIEI